MVAAGTCLPNRDTLYSAFASNDSRDTHTDTDWWKGFLKYADGMASVATTYIPGFIKIGSGIQQLIGGGIHRHTKWRSHKPALGKYSKNTSRKWRNIRRSSRSYRLLIKCQRILFLRSYISLHSIHSFTWLVKWVNLSQHFVQLVHYFDHTILVWLAASEESKIYSCLYLGLFDSSEYSGEAKW
jgi:hypothetical protein